MILTDLKTHTHAQHAQAEASLNILDPALTLDRYVALLCGLAALYAPIEDDLRRWLPAETTAVLPLTALAALHGDLSALGVKAPAGPGAPLGLQSEGQAWGALYVTEGARLGGQVIARHLQARLPLPAGQGLAFFGAGGADGPATALRWRTFGTLITARWEADPAPDAFRDDAVLGARHAFTGFTRLHVPREAVA
ncbi:biliverdin-producing heme oxygenase [Deinococcus aquiradiocola]|uniref:Heme oxygenase n=1 Tax=Deinococcus aquiradiocola TaxID=393059 RepID=A0A917PBX5_9DEIO|nr:biliverdin-producing heme oxygenase [Deinococcus aquiradiocola]GGJ70185.1 hypothetical protein GCM10008939_13250 [Deinococcus aquiradiocola]